MDVIECHPTFRGNIVDEDHFFGVVPFARGTGTWFAVRLQHSRAHLGTLTCERMVGPGQVGELKHAWLGLL